jgi:hypothetical protein
MPVPQGEMAGVRAQEGLTAGPDKPIGQEDAETGKAEKKDESQDGQGPHGGNLSNEAGKFHLWVIDSGAGPAYE